MARTLVIDQVSVTVEGTLVVHAASLAIPAGEVHALMGPNGAGKSSLANAIMGHPKFVITSGRVLLDGEDITRLPPYEKARRGLFLSPQNPPAIAGVSIASFLRAAISALKGTAPSVRDLRPLLEEKARALHLDPTFLNRDLNAGLSGGEKKQAEALQLLTLEPTFALLDETDSGLDVDALRIVAESIQGFRTPERGILLITHYQRMLEFIRPDRVHVMAGGMIVAHGGPELAEKIEKQGFGMISS